MATRERAGSRFVHTSDRLLDAAEHLIAQKGVHGFALKEIAGPVGIKVPSIYKHFKSKDEVLVCVSERFITALGMQFLEDSARPARDVLLDGLARFVLFNLEHPAYVRLALVDFATPSGGMDYVKTAAGGAFEANLASGPLAAMHQRLRAILTRGTSEGVFRKLDELDFYKVIYAALLLDLVFPEDRRLVEGFSREEVALLQNKMADLALRYVAN